jgi:hypothetical protein
MSEMLNELRGVLRREAEEVTPRPLSTGVLRRLRAKQTGVILVTSVLVGFAAVGSVMAVRALGSSFADSDLAAPRARGALDRSVYVATPEADPYESTIHMIRSGPRGPQTVRTFPARGAPALAVSPGGDRLYVVSGYGREDQLTEELVAIDVTTGGELMKAELQPQEGLFRVSVGAVPCCPTMAVSPDGRWLFILWVSEGNEGERTFYVGTFDTVEGALLPDMMPLEGCEPGIQALIPLVGVRSLAVVCEASSDVRFLEAAEGGGLKASSRLHLPVVADTRTDSFGGRLQLGSLAWATASTDGSLLYAVTLNGHVLVVNLTDRSLVAEASIDLGMGRHVGYGKVGLSSNGESMYLGLGPVSDGFDLTSATQVLEVETASWNAIRTVDAPNRFQSLVVSGGEGEVYVSGENGLARLAMRSAEVTLVPGVGQRPELVVAP